MDVYMWVLLGGRNLADLAQKKNATQKCSLNFTTLQQRFASYLCAKLSSKYKMWVAPASIWQ